MMRPLNPESGSAAPSGPTRIHPAEEARWFELFRALPELSPRPGFVGRVLASLPRRSWLDSVWNRSLLVAALGAVALSAALLVPVAFSLARLAGPASVLSLWAGAVAQLFYGLGESLTTWGRLADLARAAGVALTEPRALGLLALNIVLAFVSMRGLIALSTGRSTSHVALRS
ncbi:MAG: hypothetical protein AB7G12_12385 [Thermoanaerobaculia bacterium]